MVDETATARRVRLRSSAALQVHWPNNAAIGYGAAAAGITELDLSYTPPLGSPWDAVQTAATAWHRQTVEVA